MRRKLYTTKEKRNVKRLLRSGKSYNTVNRLTGIPKSTMSEWFGKSLKRALGKDATLKHLAKIRKSATIALKEKYAKIRTNELEQIKKNIQEELSSYPFGNKGVYKSLLSMLYWAEGSKGVKVSAAKFANTDLKLACLYITLLRKSFEIDEEKIRIGLYVHYYHSIKKVKKLWSEALHVPLRKFYKVYIKKRSKTKRFRKNFAGICFIYYRDRKIKEELLELGYALKNTICQRHS